MVNSLDSFPLKLTSLIILLNNYLNESLNSHEARNRPDQRAQTTKGEVDRGGSTPVALGNDGK